MPWIEIGVGVLGKVIAGRAVGWALKRATPVGAIFVDRTAAWFGRTYAEHYASLGETELLAFYENEHPISVDLGGRHFVLPATAAHIPIGHGRVDEQVLSFHVSADAFTLPNTLDAYVQSVQAKIAKDDRLWDGKVVRLEELNDDRAVLRQASYYSALATNFAIDNKPRGRTESLRQVVHRNGSLGPFEASPLTNHVGVVCMVESSDGLLIAQQRSKRVALRPNGISASVSGALAWGDISTSDRGASIPLAAVLAGAVREATEELGTELIDLVYLGLLRELQRGGKPEIYFFAKSPMSFHQIEAARKRAKDRTESTRLQGYEFHSGRRERGKSQFSFQRRIEVILEASAKSANFTFVAGTLLSANHILHQST